MIKNNSRALKSLGILLFLFPTFLMYSQTYIGPSFGREYTYKEWRFPTNAKNGFKSGNWFFGFIIDHYLSKPFHLSLGTTFSQKRLIFPEYTITDTQDEELRHKQIDLFMNVSLSLLKNHMIDAGINYMYKFDATFKNSLFGRTRSFDVNSTHKLNWTVGTSYKYNNLLFRLLYIQGVFKNIKNHNEYHYYMEGKYSKSISLSVSYMFKILDKRKGKGKVKCPKM